MKQQNACSIATLRIFAVLAMLWALPVAPASATPMPITLGSVFMDFLSREPGGSSGISFTVDLQNSALRFRFFVLANPERFGDSFKFTGSPNPFQELPPGVPFDLSAQASLTNPFNFLAYLDQGYRADGVVNLFTPSAELGPVPPGTDAETVVTLPFTLTGAIVGFSQFANPGAVGFELIGGGTMSAAFGASAQQPGSWELRRAVYDIVPLPVPDPATWVMVGSGLLGVAARRGSTRTNSRRSSGPAGLFASARFPQGQRPASHQPRS
jgi:hypothetical protein